MASKKKKKRAKKAECPLTVGMPDAEDIAEEGPRVSLSGAKPIRASEIFRRAKKR